MHALFETDIALERLELRELNDTAQQILTAEWDAKTAIVEKEKPAGFMSSLFRGFRPKKELPDLVEVRVSKLETMLRQKAGFRHMALFAFYLLSIVAIKLDERYSLLDRFFMPAQAEMVALADTPDTRVFPQAAEPAKKAVARDIAELNPPSTDPEGTQDTETPSAGADRAAPAPVAHKPAPLPVRRAVAPTAHAVPTKAFARKPVAAPHVAARTVAPKPAARPVARPARAPTRTAAKSVAPKSKMITSHSKKSALTRSISSVGASKAAKAASKPKKSDTTRE
jgi:hypothetical protein